MRRAARVSLVGVFLIILAGSVVRMTGSGMGCPDWPRCFGHAIPPMSEEEVLWKPNTEFHKKEIIVYNEALWVAKSDFTSGSEIQLDQNWEKYTKHDYAIFNAFHTWVEFINRLIGALTGIPILITLILAFFAALKTKKWWVFAVTFATLFMMGFEAWLGKLVVDGNLIPGSITIHMLGAILIVVFLLMLIVRSKVERINSSKRTKNTLALFGIIALIQLLLGTQVREAVDHLVHDGILDRSSWLALLPPIFMVHRSFSWIVIAVLYLALRFSKKDGEQLGLGKRLIPLVLLQIVVGVSMAYGNFPAYLQPLHLVGSIGLLAVVFERWLKIKTA